MPRHAVGDGDGPRQAGRISRRFVHRAGEEASDAADGHGGDQRQDEEIARGARHTDQLLGDLHSDQSAEESADDGLAMEEDEEARAERRAGGRAGDDGGARAVGNRIAAPLALDGVDDRRGEVAGGLEREVHGGVAGPLQAHGFACYAPGMLRRIIPIIAIAGAFTGAMYTTLGCSDTPPPPAPATLQGTVTNARTGAPLSDVMIV